MPLFGAFLFFAKIDKNRHPQYDEKNRYGQESGANPEQFYPCCEGNEKSHYH